MGVDERANHGADVWVEVVPDQDDRGVQLVVRGGDQCGVVVLGQAAAFALAATVEADPVEQPSPGRGAEADQAGHGHPSGAFPGHRHYWGVAAGGPGAGLGWAQRLSGFVLEADPAAGRRRYPRTFAQLSVRHAAMA